MLTVQNVTKVYENTPVVNDVSFGVDPGEVIGLLGANGAGKTTTMRMMAGFTRPDSGSIHVADISVADDPVAAQQQIGYLAEHTPLYLDMEVIDFLQYVAKLRGMRHAQAVAHVKEVIETCGLYSVVGRVIGCLSKGFKQRVGLAAALVHRPPLLILDEPTDGLDPAQMQELREFIRNLGRDRTVVLSTHILATVEAICDRAIVMRDGAIVGQGSIDALKGRRASTVEYRLLVNAAENMLRERTSLLGGAQIVSCKNVRSQWHEAIIQTPPKVTGENVFQWAVANGWQLRELKESQSTLEDVFCDLTREDMH